MAKKPFSLDGLQRSSFGDDRAALKERSALVKSIASKNGVTARTVNRWIDGTRSPSKDAIAKTRAVIRKSELFSTRVDGRAARSDEAKYLISRDTSKTFTGAKRRAQQLQDTIDGAADSTGNDSPTIIDHAKQITINFIPEGGRYSEETRTGSKSLTAPEGGIFLVDVRGD